MYLINTGAGSDKAHERTEGGGAGTMSSAGEEATAQDSQV